MDYDDVFNKILYDAYKSYLNDITLYRCQIPWDSNQSLYNKAINSLVQNGLIIVKARTIRFVNIVLTPYGISCASEL
ncbi:hypothetical protein K144312032_12020 [Clostridium tetani]|nr:hypothetical protein K144312032_12020 [Clostridium tetani]BDR86131.1 hypothetical protein N071400001_07390 [Clostridium tetani]